MRKRLSINGRDSLAGRKLYDAFRDASAECLLGHYVHEVGDASTVDPRVADDLVSQDMLDTLRPNVVYIEGGLLVSDDRWKVPRELAERIVANGAALIAADVDVNQFNWNKAQYRDAATFFKASADYGPNDSPGPVYGTDETSIWKGAPVCNPAEMVISDWLQPVYDGISEVIVGAPVRLRGFEGILASGNRRTGATLQDDVWVDQRGDPFPWASVASIGGGYAALIAGGVSSDVWLERCPDNTRWLLKLARHLVEQAAAERERATSHLRSGHSLFLSHRSVDKTVVDRVASEIKKLGVGIWYDKEQLLPSDSLSAELDRGLRHMTHYVLFWSERCVGAPWVERELQVAVNRLVEHRVPVVIVRLDDTGVPTIVSDLLRIEAQRMPPAQIAREIADTVRRLAERLPPRT
jgi:hypothetical protein